MSELCRSLHFLPERPPFYELSLKKTEFLEDVASQGHNFKWRVMVRFLCKPIIFLTFPLKTRDSLVPVVFRAPESGSSRSPRPFFQCTVHNWKCSFPPLFSKKSDEDGNKKNKKKTKQNIPTNQQQQKNLIAGLRGIGLYQFGLELEKLQCLSLALIRSELMHNSTCMFQDLTLQSYNSRIVFTLPTSSHATSTTLWQRKPTIFKVVQTMKASPSRGRPGKLSDEIQSMLLVN